MWKIRGGYCFGLEARADREGFDDCIDAPALAVLRGGCEQSKRVREKACSSGVGCGERRVLPVIGSSSKVHVVDALAITGDEGRGSLRKASGSRQTGFDPEMSEWGNPARKGHSLLNS